jgi:hypothetical protein
MSVKITVRSRKSGETLTFVARDDSGYVFLNPTGTSWGRQIFDRHGNAEVARSEEELRKVARRWMTRRRNAW